MDEVVAVLSTVLATDLTVPIGMRYTVVVSFFFMLRELEMGTMLFSSVDVDTVRKVVTILLPATKMDALALSCRRSWVCVCAWMHLTRGLAHTTPQTPS